jgi:hypothetical protein
MIEFSLAQPGRSPGIDGDPTLGRPKTASKMDIGMADEVKGAPAYWHCSLGVWI